VALTPRAVWTCQQIGIQYLKVDDYYSDVGLNKFAERITGVEYTWARWVDEELSKAVPEFGQAHFCPARQQLYFLKRTFDNFLFPAYALAQFVSEFRPTKLIAFERPTFLPDLDALSVERPLHSLMCPSLQSDNCKVEIWPHVEDAHCSPGKSPADIAISPRTPRGWLRQFGRKLPKSMFLLMHRWHRWLVESTHNLQNRLADGTTADVAWLGNGYDLAIVVPCLRQRHVAVWRYTDLQGRASSFANETGQVQALLNAQWDQLKVAPEFWAPLDLLNVSLRALAEPFLRRWVIDGITRSWGEFLAARQWLLEWKIDLVMTAVVGTTSASSVFSAAANLGLPRLIYIHNPPGGPLDLPGQDCLDLIQADYYLVEGHGDVEYFKSFNTRYGLFQRAQPIATGSARLDAVRQACSPGKVRHIRRALRAKNEGPFILYIPTMLFGPYRYFNDGASSDVAYFELLQRLLPVFAEYPVNLFYKPFPQDYTDNPISSFIEQRVPNGRMIRGAWPLTDLMWAADAVVLDFPSTAITEVLLTDKPVLCYAGREWARMFPEARRALLKRAMVPETPDECEAQLREFLEKRDFTPLVSPDDEFLRLYATHLNDGRSAERAADTICSVLQSKGDATE